MATLVRFQMRHGAYNAGEVAGFSDDRAQQLVESGVATFMHSDDVQALDAGPDREQDDGAHDGEDPSMVLGAGPDREPPPGWGARQPRRRR